MEGRAFEIVAAEINPGKGFFIKELATNMQYWTEAAHLGWLAIFSQENSKNANKMYSDASDFA